MHQSVQDNFMEFTQNFEGGSAIDYMFIDKEGRVGTAYGIDLDFNGNGRSPSLALSRSQGLPKAKRLKWAVRATGLPASEDEVAREWETMKALPLPAKVYTWYKQYTKLQLTQDSMRTHVIAMLKANEWTLKQNAAFKNFGSWPADAQLAVLGLSWNGAGNLLGNSHATLLHPQEFRAACQAEDFNLAANYCRMSEVDTNGSIYKRWLAQRTLLQNAAIVVREELLGSYQRPPLYWPRMLAPRAITTPPHPYLVR
jgi:hypothetical protein